MSDVRPGPAPAPNPDIEPPRATDGTRPGRGRLVALALLGVAVLAVAWYGWGLARQRLQVTFVVPDGYVGYLVTRWECPGGIALPRNALGGWGEITLRFAADGTACVADAIPRQGFRIAGFRYADGTAAPVIAGGTRGLQGDRPVGEHEFVFSPYASIGVGNGQILGDECSFREFLTARFGVAPRSFGDDCPPIYVLPNPALPLTPGIPSGPD